MLLIKGFHHVLYQFMTLYYVGDPGIIGQSPTVVTSDLLVVNTSIALNAGHLLQFEKQFSLKTHGSPGSVVTCAMPESIHYSDRLFRPC